MLRHRGPDDQGWLIYGDQKITKGSSSLTVNHGTLLLWHQRLSIIDLSKSGWQPMSTSDGRHHIVFNGEIYNYVELREELLRFGCRFTSTSDTEVLLLGYAHLGRSLLPRLVGMFAFALLDLERQELLLARDFFGIKPLYYGACSGGLAFGSELKALLALPGVPRRANAQRVYDYLHSGSSDMGDRETFYQGLYQVPPAHYVVLDLRSGTASEPVRYWVLDVNSRLDCTFEEARTHLRDLFLKNVQLHMRSDVPVAGTLSGGIDSSSVMVAMRQLRPRATMHAFSLLVDDPAVSERKWIDAVNSKIACVQHFTKPTAEELKADIGRLVYTQEEPFGSTSMYAEFRIYELVRKQGIKVVLVGDGGDELFAGYQSALGARLASLVRQGRMAEAIRFASAARSFPGMSLLKVFAYAADCSVPGKQQRFFRWFVGKQAFPAWMGAEWFKTRGVSLTVNYSPGHEKLRSLLLRQLTQAPLPSHLRCQDRSAMAHSVESRQPFLTPEMAAFALALPEGFFISQEARTKNVLREALRGLLPDAISRRRDKIGFATDEAGFMQEQGDWVEATLSSDVAGRIPALCQPALLYQWQRMRSHRTPYNGRIWRSLNLILWAQQFEVTFS